MKRWRVGTIIPFLLGPYIVDKSQRSHCIRCFYFQFVFIFVTKYLHTRASVWSATPPHSFWQLFSFRQSFLYLHFGQFLHANTSPKELLMQKSFWEKQNLLTTFIMVKTQHPLVLPQMCQKFNLVILAKLLSPQNLSVTLIYILLNKFFLLRNQKIKNWSTICRKIM